LKRRGASKWRHSKSTCNPYSDDDLHGLVGKVIISKHASSSQSRYDCLPSMMIVVDNIVNFFLPCYLYNCGILVMVFFIVGITYKFEVPNVNSNCIWKFQNISSFFKYNFFLDCWTFEFKLRKLHMVRNQCISQIPLYWNSNYVSKYYSMMQCLLIRFKHHNRLDLRNTLCIGIFFFMSTLPILH